MAYSAIKLPITGINLTLDRLQSFYHFYQAWESILSHSNITNKSDKRSIISYS